MKNYTFYNREAESFWLILGCRGVLGFLLVFQIIPPKAHHQNSPGTQFEDHGEGCSQWSFWVWPSGPSQCSSWAGNGTWGLVRKAVSGLLQELLNQNSHQILKIPRFEKHWSAHTARVTSTKGISCLSSSYVGLANGFKVRVASVLSFLCFSVLAVPWMGNQLWETVRLVLGLAEEDLDGMPVGPAGCMFGNVGDTAFQRRICVSSVAVLTAHGLGECLY